MECGAGTKAVKKLYDSCGGGILIETAFFGAGLAAANIDFLLSYGKSFDGGTKIMTRKGYAAIRDIAVGDEVAAIDEKTGRKVWRKVTQLFSRQAPNTLDVELEDENGKRIKIRTTLEHPFHVEERDHKVETMIAYLRGAAAVDPSRLFPSDGRTPFGDWVNAGALKAGDKVSTRDTIDNYGPRFEVNDNLPLTVTEIVRDSRAARVYNFEVESRDGEVTHNYFVGDDAVWVHNKGSHKFRAPNPYRDGSGRNHEPNFPNEVPRQWGPGEISDAIDELTCSIEARKAQMCACGGGDAGHHQRLRIEKRFLRKLLGAIGR